LPATTYISCPCSDGTRCCGLAGLWNGVMVAVKQMEQKARRGPVQADDDDVLKKAQAEAWMNSRLRHPHIVQLYTSYTVKEGGRAARSAGATGRPLLPDCC
jgi:hypothetical protein